ncbi:hypothetical protein [Microcystis phage Mwe-Yong1]|nr:hypothetical protein [Microcystis phage Mwe-Yong1]
MQKLLDLRLSDGLEALIRNIEPTRRTGLVINRTDVVTLLQGLEAMRDEARHLETIVDRVQWNNRAARDNQRARRAALETSIADGSVVLLPVVARPTAIVRDEEGGAA